MAMILGRLQGPEDFREDFTPHNKLQCIEQGPITMQGNAQGMHPHVMQSCQHAQVRREGVASLWCMQSCPPDALWALHGGLHDMLGSLLPPKTCQQLGRVCAMIV